MAANFMAARNFSGRPTLMHKVSKNDVNKTLCGYDMSDWSRAYFLKPVDLLLCKRCKMLISLKGSFNKKAWSDTRTSVTEIINLSEYKKAK